MIDIEFSTNKVDYTTIVSHIVFNVFTMFV